MNAADLITKARAGLLFDAPFFASLALRLTPVEDKTCKTAYTDGNVLGYNPDFVHSLSMSELKGLIAHEVMHIVGCHHLRRQSREPSKWNVACDYAINDILVASRVELPSDALTGYGIDKSAEQIYNMLPKEEGSDKGKGQGQSNSDSSDPGGCGEVRDLPGGDGGAASEAELSKAESEVKVMVAQAAQQAMSMGQMPAKLDRLVRDIVDPKVNWVDVLRRFVQLQAKNDYRMMPPNRRYIHRGLYLPSLRSEELPEVVIAVDTSGSITDKDVDQFASEISSMLQNFDTNITVLYCDTKISNVEEFTSRDLPLQLHPKGGGGTDFRPPFNWVEEQQRTPCCLIYLTDLQCYNYPPEPEYPVMWAHIGGGSFKVPFGEIIEIKQ